MIDRITLSGALIAAAALAVSAVIVVLLYVLVGGTDVEQEVRLVGIVTTPAIIRLDAPGDSQELLLQGRYSDRSVGDLEGDYIGAVSYSNTNPSVARVDSSGIVTGMETGGAEISIHLDSFTTTVPVFVSGPLREIPPVDPTRLLQVSDNGSAIVLNRAMIELESGYDSRDAARVASTINGRVIFEYRTFPGYLVEFDATSQDDLEGTLAILLSDRRVASAYPDLVFAANQDDEEPSIPIETLLLPSNCKRTVQGAGCGVAYHLAGMPEAWAALEQTDDLAPVGIVVVDSGFVVPSGNAVPDEVLRTEFDYDSMILKHAHLLPFANSYPDAIKYAEHGATVTSVIVARNNDRTAPGITGESFSGVVTSVDKLDYTLPFYGVGIRVKLPNIDRVIPQGGNVVNSLEDISRYEDVIDVVNLSIEFDCNWYSALCRLPYIGWRDRFKELMGGMPDVTFVIAAGNSSSDIGNSLPAALSRDLPNAITVGASSQGTRRAGFSNFGPAITLGAPGEDVLGVYLASSTGYAYVQGTSYAAPMVAGTVALLRSLDPTIEPREIRELLVDTGTRHDVCDTAQVPCPPADQARWSMLDAGAAVGALLWDSVDAEIDIMQASPTEGTAGSIVELNIPVRNTGTRAWNFHMDGTFVSPSGATVEFEPVQNLIPSGGSHPFKLRVWANEAGVWDIEMEIFKDSQMTMPAGSETLKLQVIPSASTSATGSPSAQRSTPAAPSAPSTPAGVLQVDANVLVLADTSGSMEGEKIESLRSSVLDFVGRIDDAGEYVGLIDFDDEVTETIPLGPFGTDLNRWDQAVETLDGDGGTAFYDAVSYAISVLENEGVSGRVNIIIALTDGFDEDSQLTANEVISKLQGASVPVLLFALAYGEEYDLPVLEQLAEATGGVAYPATPEDLERLFALLSTLF